ncbi:MAG: hypothetical protein RPG89_15090 [Microcystis panniformis WG22]|nr:hypothetical protein [Microcystis panniformis WG22]
MTNLVDHLKAQSLSEKGIALLDVSHDYGKLVSAISLWTVATIFRDCCNGDWFTSV